ncbi:MULTISPECIES: spore coat U domain-containing protein [unclassified Raoultella]|uniref:Csu type fimbrial protein n=1 Tax=unclassified Raoultella TaxID=2627600 RepID=UPI0013572BAD|nr:MULTISPECIES: spore coat U domain-containing protein [unclassified Raoultella]
MIRKSKVVFALGSAGMLISSLVNAATTATANLDVTLRVEASCVLAVDPLDFGTHAIGDAGIAEQTSATVTCTAGTPYILTSDSTHTYQMTNASGTAGTNTIDYTLYLDNAGTEPLAEALPDDTQVAASSDTGTGAAQVIPIYGKVNNAFLSDVAAGTYTDTVTLQVTY